MFSHKKACYIKRATSSSHASSEAMQVCHQKEGNVGFWMCEHGCFEQFSLDRIERQAPGNHDKGDELFVFPLQGTCNDFPYTQDNHLHIEGISHGMLSNENSVGTLY